MFLLILLTVFQDSNISALLQQSESLVKQEKWTEALALVLQAEHQVEKGTPTRVKRLIYYRAGYLTRKLGKSDEAIAWLSRAFSLKADKGTQDDVQFKAGNLLISELRQTGKTSLASETWQKWEELRQDVSLDVSITFNHLIQGVSLSLEQGDLDQAQSLSNKAIRIFEEHQNGAKVQITNLRQILLQLLTTYQAKGQYQTGIHCLDFLRENHINSLLDDPFLLFKFSELQMQVGNSVEAAHYLQKTCDLTQDKPNLILLHGQALFGIAEIYSIWNNHKEAKPIFEEAEKILSANLPAEDPRLLKLRKAMETNQSQIIHEEKKP